MAAIAAPVLIDLTDRADALPPALFRRVIGCAAEHECDSEILSKFVVEYCRGQHAEEVNGSLLAEVTESEMMPTLDPESAFKLMELASIHMPLNAASLHTT